MVKVGDYSKYLYVDLLLKKGNPLCSNAVSLGGSFRVGQKEISAHG